MRLIRTISYGLWTILINAGARMDHKSVRRKCNKDKEYLSGNTLNSRGRCRATTHQLQNLSKSISNEGSSSLISGRFRVSSYESHSRDVSTHGPHFSPCHHHTQVPTSPAYIMFMDGYISKRLMRACQKSVTPRQHDLAMEGKFYFYFNDKTLFQQVFYFLHNFFNGLCLQLVSLVEWIMIE